MYNIICFKRIHTNINLQKKFVLKYILFENTDTARKFFKTKIDSIFLFKNIKNFILILILISILKSFS